ncbi:Gfo/Idh/MocA family protein [Chloroflexota bacterium]
MVQTAFIGTAHIHTPGFIKRLNDRAEVSVKYVWDHDMDRAQKNAVEVQAEAVADLATIWDDPAVTSVVICAETDRHQPLVLAAAVAGKHMFVEKPLGMGAADAYEMAAAIDEAGVIFQTGYFMRGNPVHLFLREQIKAGSLGKITRFRHSNVHSGSIGRWFDTDWRWMADLEQSGIGGFGDLGTHSLDIMMWLLGDVASVTASVDVALENYGACDEYGEGLLKFENGVLGSLAAGWVDVANPLMLGLYGTEGQAYVVNGDLFFKSEHVKGADGEKPWTDLPDGLPHAFELFLDALMGTEGLPLVSPQEAAARSAVMEALYQAAEQQTWVAPVTG